MVDLGLVNTFLEVSMLSSRLVLPREDHLNQLHHMLSSLKKHNNRLIFDPSDPAACTIEFMQIDWVFGEFSHVLREVIELLARIPRPRRIGFPRRAKFNANHASDTTTRMSRTGFVC